MTYDGTVRTAVKTLNKHRKVKEDGKKKETKHRHHSQISCAKSGAIGIVLAGIGAMENKVFLDIVFHASVEWKDTT